MRIELKWRAESYSMGCGGAFLEWSICDLFHSQNNQAHRCYLTIAWLDGGGGVITLVFWREE